MFTNFISMSTWLEPFGGYNGYAETSFPGTWTIFYWAWWLAFAPSVGIFIARISRGRTIANMVFGALIWGSLGCALFFMVLGNYAAFLQLSGEVDVLTILSEESHGAAIYAVLGALPLGTIAVAVFTFLTLIFLSTTFDSISYILAAAVQTKVEDEPLRWNRLFWAAALSAMPIVLLFMEGDSLQTLQTASIVGGAPLLIIAVLLCAALVKIAKRDLNQASDAPSKEVSLTEFEPTDPWD